MAWYDNKPYPLCPALTYKEWERLFEKDEQAAVDLSARLMRRETRLELGHASRVPKHRYNKKRYLP